MASEQSYTSTQPIPSGLPTTHKPESADLLVLVDSELARLAVGLFLAAQFRLWLIGHDLSTQRHSGRGWITKDDLWNILSQIGIHITKRHFRRLLQRGDGRFWRIHQDRIYLRSIKFVAEELCIEAGLQKQSLVATNLPAGRRSVWIPVNGAHERFEAFIYAGWLAAHETPTIARDTLEKLFNRSAETLRRWEKNRLDQTINVVPGYAIMNDVAERPAEHAFYDKSIRSWVYQLPNTYQVALRQTVHNGQRRKVKHAVHPADYGDGGDKMRVYFATIKGMKRADRRHESDCTRFSFGYSRGGRFYFRRSADIFMGH